MKKVFVLIFAILLFKISFAFGAEAFEFFDNCYLNGERISCYEVIFNSIFNLFPATTTDFEKKSPPISKLQLILRNDPFTYRGDINGFYDSNTSNGIKSLQSDWGWTPNGDLNFDTMRNIFPKCKIEFTFPNVENLEVKLRQPVEISWKYNCETNFGSFVLDEDKALNRILKLIQAKIYLVKKDRRNFCSNYNNWWYRNDPQCAYLLIGRVPLSQNSFIWIPDNIRPGKYVLRLVPQNFQIFQRDLDAILGFVPNKWARFFAESDEFEIIEETPIQGTTTPEIRVHAL
jgi:hypothetical protein